MADPQTLAAMVRAKYPGVYDDLSDADLDAKVRSKYPGVYDDISDVELEAKVKAKYPGVYDDIPMTTPNASAGTRSATGWPAQYPKTAQVVGGVLNALPAAGAIAGGVLASPETFGTAAPLGVALGAGVGVGARKLATEALGLEPVTSPIAKAKQIATDIALTGITQAVLPVAGPPVRAVGRAAGKVMQYGSQFDLTKPLSLVKPAGEFLERISTDVTPAMAKQAIAKLNPETLSAWEKQFVASISDWVSSGRDLTLKQAATLRRIVQASAQIKNPVGRAAVAKAIQQLEEVP